MTVAPPKPSFKRSTERSVVDPNEAIVVRADRLAAKERDAFEARAEDPVSRGGRIHDESRFDLEGLVYP